MSQIPVSTFSGDGDALRGVGARPSVALPTEQESGRVQQASEQLAAGRPQAPGAPAGGRLQPPWNKCDPVLAHRLPTVDDVRSAVGRAPQAASTRLFGLYRYEHDKHYRKIEAALGEYEATRNSVTVDDLRRNYRAIDVILEAVAHYDRKWIPSAKSKGVLQSFNPETCLRLAAERKLSYEWIDGLNHKLLTPEDVAAARQHDPQAFLDAIGKSRGSSVAVVLLANAGVPLDRLGGLRLSRDLARQLTGLIKRNAAGLDVVGDLLAFKPGVIQNALGGLNDEQLVEAIGWIHGGLRPDAARLVVDQAPSVAKLLAAYRDGHLPKGAFIIAVNSPRHDKIEDLLGNPSRLRATLDLLGSGISPSVLAELPDSEWNKIQIATSAGKSSREAWQTVNPAFKLTAGESPLFLQHDIDPDKIDADRLYRDENVMRIGPALKGGALNRPRLVTFRGTDNQPLESVFKPWQGGQRDADRIPLAARDQGIDLDKPQYEQRNIMSFQLAAALGWHRGNKKAIPESHYCIIRGRLGLVMDKAPGSTSLTRRFAVNPDFSDGCKIVYNQFQTGKLSPEELQRFSKTYGIRFSIEEGDGGTKKLMGEAREAMIVGRDPNDPGLQQGLARLQLFDCLAGQGDRHIGNIILAADQNGKIQSVVGIDNDISFGKRVTTIDPYSVPGFALCHGKGMPAVIDTEMAQDVLALDPEQLHHRFIGPDADAEFAAFQARVGRVKALIQAAQNNDPTSTLRIIQPEEWGAGQSSHIQKGRSYLRYYVGSDVRPAKDYGIPDPVIAP
jgi:hypothetical protein